MLEQLNSLRAEFGTSYDFTHNLGIVARYADSVKIVYGGKIVEGGQAWSKSLRIRTTPCTIGLISAVPRLDLLQPRPHHH